MILVTVGSAPYSFLRLIEAADQLAVQSGQEVIIQYGLSKPILKNSKGFAFIPYDEMLELFQKAEIVISHASAGPVLFAERYRKPLILFPRSGDRGEHIDNHQLEFSKALSQEGTEFEILYDEKELWLAVQRTLLKKQTGPENASRRAEVTKEIERCLGIIEMEKKERFRKSGWRKLKELLYYFRVYRFLSSLWNHTFWMLRNGYEPKDFWERWSGRYVREKLRSAIGSSHIWLAEKVKQKRSGGRILEAGMANGKTLEYLYESTGRLHQFYGVDISQAMISRAVQSLPPILASHSLCADVAALPFLDNSFDVVFTRGVLMHCADQKLEAVLRELERVSKGEIYLIEETFWSPDSSNGKSFSLNAYTFIHDYEKVLNGLGWEITEKQRVEEAVTVLECRVCLTSKSKSFS